MPVRLSHEIFGTGEPLVILHGLFGSKRNWFSLAKQLGEFARVIAVDLRNHGDSEHAPSMAYEEMAEDVVFLLNSLRIPAATVAGHSMGGKAAMLCALNHPDRTRRLMVLDVAPVRYETDFGGYIEAMRAMPLAHITSRREAEAHLADAVPEEAVRQFLLHNLVREDGAFRWRINLDAIAANLEELSGFPEPDAATPFRGPTRFVAGGRSDYLQPAHEPAIRRWFPEARIETIADAGHWIHADQPRAVLEAIRSLLAEPVED